MNRYSDYEIRKKEQYFLSLEPVNKNVVSQERWLYEIKRVFELNSDFKKNPDKYFKHLETFRKMGR